MSQDRIDFSNDQQYRWLHESLETLESNWQLLNDFQYGFYERIKIRHDTFGRKAWVTRKQLEYLKQLAYEIETMR